MPAPPTIYIVCSDRGRNGKTLLARVLTDHLLIDERDPFCFDLSAPEGALRAYFPGRTALIDINDENTRAKLFDIILSRTGRDYVIDVPGAQFARFCEAAADNTLPAEPRANGNNDPSGTIQRRPFGDSSEITQRRPSVSAINTCTLSPVRSRISVAISLARSRNGN